jgi:hypothetical protein
LAAVAHNGQGCGQADPDEIFAAVDAGDVGGDLVGGGNGICLGGRADGQDNEVVDSGGGSLPVCGEALE